MNEIYLDHAASTPVRREVAELQLRVQLEHPANPSSVHRAGQRARRVLEAAREQAALALGAAAPAELIFTSGATEALNQLLFGLAGRPGFRRLLVSPLEHPAVMATARELRARGVAVTELVPEGGAITGNVLAAADTGPGDVVVAMLVNNETGVISPVRHLANVAHRRGALLVSDVTQAVGFEPVSLLELHADAVVLSGHKFGGPRGAGLLWLRDGLELAPYLHGGAQERGRRAGTSDVAAFAGLALALELAVREQPEVHERLRRLRHLFEELAGTVPGVSVVGADLPRCVKHSCLSVGDVDGEGLFMALDATGVQASAGSACSAGSVEPSHVLLALGYSPGRARSTFRFSFGATTTEDDVREAAARFREAVQRSRAAGTLGVADLSAVAEPGPV